MIIESPTCTGVAKDSIAFLQPLMPFEAELESSESYNRDILPSIEKLIELNIPNMITEISKASQTLTVRLKNLDKVSDPLKRKIGEDSLFAVKTDFVQRCTSISTEVQKICSSFRAKTFFTLYAKDPAEFDNARYELIRNSYKIHFIMQYIMDSLPSRYIVDNVLRKSPQLEILSLPTESNIKMGEIIGELTFNSLVNSLEYLLSDIDESETFNAIMCEKSVEILNAVNSRGDSKGVGPASASE
ncbi:MAG: hypothetical protein K940chlam6_00508 [Chlamydiae bacterium]|nr:hypothetical protein [Chlamydiota bacterium]